MPIKELNGDDIVKIINAGKKADMEMIEIGGELKLMFKREITTHEPKEGGFAYLTFPPDHGAPEEIEKPEEQDDFEAAMLAVTDPTEWEQSQLKTNS